MHWRLFQRDHAIFMCFSLHRALRNHTFPGGARAYTRAILFRKYEENAKERLEYTVIIYVDVQPRHTHCVYVYFYHVNL